MTPARPRTKRDGFAWWKRLAFWRRFLAMRFALYRAFGMVRADSKAAIWLEQNLDVLEQALATLLLLSPPQPGVEPAPDMPPSCLAGGARARIKARLKRLQAIFANPAPHIAAAHARAAEAGFRPHRAVIVRPSSPTAPPLSLRMTPLAASEPVPSDTS